MSNGSAADGSLPWSAFKDLDTATIYEAQGRTGDLPASIKPIGPDFRLCGPAFTIESPSRDNLWLHRAVALASPGDVLVVALASDGDREAGYWGEVLSEAALVRGLGGLVIDACVRDGARLAAVGFPVFATGLCIRGTDKDASKRGSLNQPIKLGHTVVSPGDIVVGDVDGTVAIPAHRVDVVAVEARRRMESEHRIFERLRSGESTLDIYGLTQAQSSS